MTATLESPSELASEKLEVRMDKSRSLEPGSSTFSSELEQGLGTGSIYSNNIDSPLFVSKGELYFDTKNRWGDLPE